jgi:outer membrane receptor protein involved in Fe transport
MILPNKPHTIIATLMAIPFATSAIAQSVNEQTGTPNDTSNTIEVIEVSAQKRITPLQETPIAISAFSSTMLADQDIEDAQDIQFAIPNTLVSNNSSFSIRGVGNQAISATSDPGLGVHVNGVYLSTAWSARYSFWA